MKRERERDARRGLKLEKMKGWRECTRELPNRGNSSARDLERIECDGAHGERQMKAH